MFISRKRFWVLAIASAAIADCGLLIGSASASVWPTAPSIPNKWFNVDSYGAVGNGRTTDTSAIQNAIDAAARAGGGNVYVPSGTYLSGSLNLLSHVDLNLSSGSMLEMLPKYQYSSASTPFISGNRINNAEITGQGTINGQGNGWWSNKSSTRPYLVKFSNSYDLAVEGVTLENSPKENLGFDATNNVTINGVSIYAPANSPNTDAIDPSGYNYLIENSKLSVGDDDIAIKALHNASGNIVINKMSIGSGHGISIGGQTNYGVNGMWVSNVTFNGTTNGLRMKAGPGYGGTVQNINYNNIKMTNVKNPLEISSWYENGGDHFPSSPSSAVSSPVTSTTPIWKNITYTNVTATGADQAGIIYGLPKEWVDNVTLNNVHISAKKGMDIYYAWHTVFENGTTITASSGNPLSTYDATITYQNSKTMAELSAIATPEPAPLAMLACGGLVAFGLLRRRCQP